MTAATLKRVAVTGLGVICALGHDVAEVWPAILAGRTGIAPITSIPTDRLSAKLAGQVGDYDPVARFSPRQLAMLDRTSQLALTAAQEAIQDAGLPASDSTASRRGVVLGTSYGQDTIDVAYQSLYGAGAKRLPPLTVPRIMPSAPVSHIGMTFGLRGPSFAAASACASANHAIGLAMQIIRANGADVMVTGGADASIVVGVLKAWEALRVLSAEGCRPFSKDRSGLVLGEGAGILVLEGWEHAVARGARIYAELAGVGMSADAADLTAPDLDGACLAIEGALTDAGLTPEEIGYVNAHGTGTRLNDRTESAALHRVWAGRPPPVSSSKGAVGHCLAAGGAVEAVATVLALHHGVLPPTAGFREADPECDVDPVPQARPADIRAALSNSFAFGGLNAVIAFRRAA